MRNTSITSSPTGLVRLDFEVYEVTAVVGHGVGADSEQEFRPFYAAYSADEAHEHTAYFTTRREPRLVSAEQKRRGARSSYIGSEVFLALVDSRAGAVQRRPAAALDPDAVHESRPGAADAGGYQPRAISRSMWRPR